VTTEYFPHERQQLLQRQIALDLIAAGEHEKRIARFVATAAIQRDEVARLDEPGIIDDRMDTDRDTLDWIDVHAWLHRVFDQPQERSLNCPWWQLRRTGHGEGLQVVLNFDQRRHDFAGVEFVSLFESPSANAIAVSPILRPAWDPA